MNIQTLIFSRDRAMQLDAALRSFFLHCQDAELADLNVLYRASTPQSASQYEILKTEYAQVHFIEEKDFRKDLEKILLQYYDDNAQRFFYLLLSRLNQLQLPGSSLLQKIRRGLPKMDIYHRFIDILAPLGNRSIFFIVDDNIFIRPFKFEMITDALKMFPDALGFSLRLGRNTTYCYSLNSNQALPEFTMLGDQIIVYDWTNAEFDFNYPLEVSSSIYRVRQILPLLALFPYNHPNTLEGEMAERSSMFAKKFPRLLCFETSVAFCNPINKVQNVAKGNRAALTHPYSTEELAQRFDNGDRIDIEAYSGFVPNACHQEVELVFKKGKTS